MALYSGISVMMTLLAFATLLGFTNGLMCYRCFHHSQEDPYPVDCRGSTVGNLEQAKKNEVCTKMHGTGTRDGKSFYTESRGHGTLKEKYIPPTSTCKEYKDEIVGTRSIGTYTVCSCNDKDGCNGVVGLGSDVNVILRFGVIALILGYLRQ